MTTDRKLLVLLVLFTVIAIGVVGIFVAMIQDDDASKASGRPEFDVVTATVTETVYEPESVDEETDPESVDEEPEPVGPATTFGDGVYEVGVDVAPGRYRNAGDTYDGEAPCVAYTTRKPNDLNTHVKGSTSSGPGIIDLERGLFLTVQGCQEWRKAG